MTSSETPEDTMTSMARQDSEGSADGVVRTTKQPLTFDMFEEDDDDLQRVDSGGQFGRIAAVLFGVVCVLAATAWCGMQLGARQQFNRWQKDGDVDEDASSKCIVDVSLGNGGDGLVLQRLSGETTSISLIPGAAEVATSLPVAPKADTPPSTAAGLADNNAAPVVATASASSATNSSASRASTDAPATAAASSSSSRDAATAAASSSTSRDGATAAASSSTSRDAATAAASSSTSRDGATAAAGSSTSRDAAATPAPRFAASAEVQEAMKAYPDLTCFSTTVSEWQDFKVLTGKWFGSWSSGVVPKSKAQLQSLTELAVRKLAAVHDKVDECAMGRLFVSLLGLASGEGTLKSMPHLSSPLLTILLDIPWAIVMRSGWPLFALLAQLHLQQQGTDDLPTSGPDQVYFQALKGRLMSHNSQVAQKELAILGAEFVRLQQDESTQNQRFLVFPALCALASQLFGQETDAGVDQALHHMQSFFKQAVMNIDDLQSTLVTSWPLYGLLNAASTTLV